MPSRDRFLLSFEPAADYLRRNPLTVIGGGAILCGAAVAAVILTAAPHQPVIAAGSVPPASAVAKKVEPARPGLEAVGQATPVQNADARGAECESQTWPYISRSCLTRDDTERRKVRVIATDQLSMPLVAAIEAPPAESDKSVRATVVMPKRDVAAPGLPGSAPVVREQAQEETATAAVAMPLPLRASGRADGRKQHGAAARCSRPCRSRTPTRSHRSRWPRWRPRSRRAGLQPRLSGSRWPSGGSLPPSGARNAAPSASGPVRRGPSSATRGAGFTSSSAGPSGPMWPRTGSARPAEWS